jgi:hypothetical protein
MCKHKGKVGRALAEKQAANRIADAGATARADDGFGSESNLVWVAGGATTNDWLSLTVTE